MSFSVRHFYVLTVYRTSSSRHEDSLVWTLNLQNTLLRFGDLDTTIEVTDSHGGLYAIALRIQEEHPSRDALLQF